MTQSITFQPKNESPTIRPATKQEVSTIVSLGAKTFAAAFGHSMPASDLQAYLSTSYTLSALSKELEDPLIDTFVACNPIDHHVTGFIQLRRGTMEPCLEGMEGTIEIQRLYVDEKYHGLGVGGALLKHVQNVAKDLGFVHLWLGVWEENFKAQKVYERFNFRKIGVRKFVLGSCVQHDWIMISRL